MLGHSIDYNKLMSFTDLHNFFRAVLAGKIYFQKLRIVQHKCQKRDMSVVTGIIQNVEP